MELCEENHRPIVHGERDCPLCEAVDENEILRDEIETHECVEVIGKPKPI